MRKIAIIGGTGIDNPDTLKGFEKKNYRNTVW